MKVTGSSKKTCVSLRRRVRQKNNQRDTEMRHCLLPLRHCPVAKSCAGFACCSFSAKTYCPVNQGYVDTKNERLERSVLMRSAKRGATTQQFCFVGWAAGIPTTDFTSLQARLWRMAEPLSCRSLLSDSSELTATLVVTLMLLRVLLQYCHSEMYSSHSELLRFSNKLANCKKLSDQSIIDFLSGKTYK